ncbi:DUF222 domain-containing protein [Saxibacter everestensis]|uniref:DUF222 domain-containing protein n=1 Tax=Saxibacter everestensis TaxID=2909229 RepID=A0ABY8QPG4_9MICO|nr:DUF222 domain-containing protein [Brevibacteriaceae bacterium ZFBP1038]
MEKFSQSSGDSAGVGRAERWDVPGVDSGGDVDGGGAVPSTLAAECHGLIAAVTASLRRLIEEIGADLAGLSDPEVLQVAEDLQGLSRRLDGAHIRVAGAIDRREIAAAAGERSTVSLLTNRLRINAGEAKHRLDLAAAVCPAFSLTGQKLPAQAPATVAALDEGRIGADHARVLIQRLAVIREKAETASASHPLAASPDEVVAAAEAQLIEQALRHDPAFVDRCARHWIDTLDPDGTLPSEAETRQQHGLWFGAPLRSGLVPFRGAMSSEDHETLLAAAGPATSPRRHGDCETQSAHPADAARADPRTYQHKLLDGLVAVCAGALKAGAVSANGTKATILVTIDHRVLYDQLAGGGAFAYTGPVPAAVVRKMACDASLVPVVLGGKGQVLDVGKGKRLFTGAQRRAIIARDRGCIIPGCTTPAAWCAAHHVEFYSRGGRTAVPNGALLCEHHHGLVHQGHWRIVTRSGVPWAIAPAWIDPAQQPRRNHYHHPPDPGG